MQLVEGNILAIFRIFEACMCQRMLQLLCSEEKKERASWTKRGMSSILLTCRIIFFIPIFCPLSLSWIPIRSMALAVKLALHASNRDKVISYFAYLHLSASTIELWTASTDKNLYVNKPCLLLKEEHLLLIYYGFQSICCRSG